MGVLVEDARRDVLALGVDSGQFGNHLGKDLGRVQRLADGRDPAVVHDHLPVFDFPFRTAGPDGRTDEVPRPLLGQLRPTVSGERVRDGARTRGAFFHGSVLRRLLGPFGIGGIGRLRLRVQLLPFRIALAQGGPFDPGAVRSLPATFDDAAALVDVAHQAVGAGLVIEQAQDQVAAVEAHLGLAGQRINLLLGGPHGPPRSARPLVPVLQFEDEVPAIEVQAVPPGHIGLWFGVDVVADPLDDRRPKGCA